MSQSFSPDPHETSPASGGNSSQNSAKHPENPVNAGNLGTQPPIVPPKLTSLQIPPIPQTQLQTNATHLQAVSLPTPAASQTYNQTHAQTHNQTQTQFATPMTTSTPTVPMHVYRELAAELQSTKAMLEAVQQQNQRLSQQNLHLTQQNQHFQAEMVNVVNAALSMRQTAESFQAPPDDLSREVTADQPIAPLPPVIDATYAPTASSFASPSSISHTSNPGSSSSTSSPTGYPVSYSTQASPQTLSQTLSQTSSQASQTSNPPTRLYTEQPGGYEPWSNPGEEPGERSGLWLLVAIVATIVTAFGAGYWLVRPLLNPSSGR